MKNSTVPKYFRKDVSIKTIDIQGKEWFDKVNGNSYNSVCVSVNHGLKNEFSFSIPFQYGYGNYFEQSAFEHLQKIGVVTDRSTITRRAWENKVKVNSYIERKCLQREVKAHGKIYPQI